MTERIPQSTAKLVVFKAYLSSDHVTEATGKTIAITISKNGGAFGNPNAGALNATEISSGWYKVTLDTTDTGTLGPLAIRGAVATIDDVGILIEVVAATNGGLTALPAVAAGATNGLPLSVDSSGRVDVLKINGTSQTAGDVFARLGAPAGASMCADIAAVKVDTAAVKVQTDKLTFTVANQIDSNVLDWKSAPAPAMTGDAFARLGAPTGASVSVDMAAVKSDSAAVKAKTDSLTFTVAGKTDTNITHVKGTAVTGSGTAGSPWGP